MELSYFISMLQYEVLKSFDFNKEFQNEIDEETNSQIQLSIDKAEIEIPLVFYSSKKEVKIENENLSKEAEIKKIRHELPFNSSISILHKKDRFGKYKPFKRQIIKSKDIKNKKGEQKVTGDVINVLVANSDMKKDEFFDSSLIGKIKISIKPILK